MTTDIKIQNKGARVAPEKRQTASIPSRVVCPSLLTGWERGMENETEKKIKEPF